MKIELVTVAIAEERFSALEANVERLMKMLELNVELNSLPKQLTIEAAAEYIGISANALYKRKDNGEVSFSQESPRAKIYIPAAEVLRLKKTLLKAA